MSGDDKIGYRSYRNQFRRPSALGVPRGEFKEDSEYDKNYREYEVERSNPYYQKDNLKSEGLDFGKGTELRDQYQEYQTQKPQRVTKYNDNLRNEGQVETVTGYKNDYNEKKVERPKQSRPNDYLGPEGDQDFNTDKKMAYQQHFVNRPTRERGKGDNLALDGQRETDTDYKREYGEKQGERSRATRPNDYLGPEGDQDFSTDKNLAYRRHSVSKPSKGRGVDDNLALAGDRETDTDYKREYGQKQGERSKASRPNDYLGPEGDQDFSTDKNLAYRRHSVSKPSKGRGVDDNLALSGERETDTDYKREYGEKHGERSRATRPNDYLGPEGDQDFSTDKNMAYQRHSVSKPTKGRGVDDNLALSGDRETDTDYKREYGQKQGERSKASRPNDYLGPEGDQDFSTDKNLAYRRHSVSKPSKGRGVDDNLGLFGDRETETENKREYGEKHGERSRAARPNDYLGPEGDQDFSTDKNMAYQRHLVSKPSKGRGVDDNLGLYGDRETETDYNREYGEKHGERSKASRPNDYLGPEGDLDFETDKNLAYKRHSVSKPSKGRGVDDNLGLYGERETDTDYKREYGEKKGERSQAARPRDYLGPEGDQEFETDKNMAYRRHSVSRPTKGKAYGDSLGLEGDLENDTENKREYGEKRGERSKLTRPTDYLGPTGDQDFNTDKNIAYRRHSVSKPSKNRGKDDTLGLEGDLESETDYRREYGEKRSDRVRGTRPVDYLEQQGEYDFNTDKGIAYKNHDVARPDRYRGKDDSLFPEGVLDDETDYKREYGEKHGEKPKAYRPEDFLALAGDRDFQTDNNVAYQKHQASKPERYRARGDNLALEGNLEDETAYRNQFQGRIGERGKLQRPGDVLGPDGEQEFYTDKQMAYQQHDVERPTKQKGRNGNLAIEGDFERETDYQREYSEKHGERQKGYRPEDYLGPHGEQTFDTDKGIAYQKHDISRPERYSRKGDHLIMEGDLDDRTAYKHDYQEKHADRHKPHRPEENLALEGDREFDTDKNIAYTRHGVGKPSKYKAKGDTLALQGDLEKESYYRQEFGEKRGQRVNPTRPHDFLGPEGNQDFETHISRTYQPHDVKRPERMKGHQEGLVRNEGSFDSRSKYGEDYQGQMSDRTKPIKASNNLKSTNAPLEGNTEYYDKYLPQDITERAQARRPKSQLVKNSQDFEKDTETRSQFSQVHGGDDLLKRGREEQVRARRANATDNLRQNNGRLEGVSETQSKYDVKPYINQVSKATRKDNLILNKDKMEDVTEAKANFEPKYGRRSGGKKGPQPDNLKSNQDPFEGMSDTKASYGITSVSRTKPIKPRTSLQRNEGKFADGSITKYSYDYRSGFPTKKPQKVRVGSQLRPGGGIEGQTEYSEEYLKTNGERANWVAVNDLLTPFGHPSHETRHLGHVEHAL